MNGVGSILFRRSKEIVYKDNPSPSLFVAQHDAVTSVLYMLTYTHTTLLSEQKNKNPSLPNMAGMDIDESAKHSA